MRTKRIILVQGTQPKGLVDWSFLWRTNPNFQNYTVAAQHIRQNLLFDLVRFCEEGPGSFSAEQRTGITQLLTFIATWARWQDLLPELLPAQQRRHLPNTLLVGHSFGTWIAAGLLGSWGGFRKTFNAMETRATHTCTIRGAAAIIRSDPRQEPELDFALLPMVCERAQGTYLGVINTPWQAVASGTEEGIQELHTMLKALKMRSHDFLLEIPWHHPTLMAKPRMELKQILKGMEMQRLRAPIGYLDRAGKLRRTKSPRIIRQLLLQELTEQLNFWSLACQLSKTAELIELSVHDKPFLTKFVEEARAVQTFLQKASAPVLQAN